MTEWKARRFWTTATVAPLDGGFGVHLDARPLRTPGKAVLSLPTRRAAEAVAAEWQAQDEVIVPALMPVTLAANAAIDKVAAQQDEVTAMLAAYGETDLLCYRAEAPEALLARQAEAWDPLLDWAQARYGARLTVAQGVMFVAQPEPALERLADPLRQMSPFQLTGLHDLVALSGSLVIALAAIENHLPVDTLWQRSRIDETWQEDHWGTDSEAGALTQRRWQAFERALTFFRLVTGPG